SQANQSHCGAVDAKGAVEADSQRRVPSLPRWQGHRNHWSARRCHRLTAVFRFMLLVRLAAVRADRHRPGAIDGGVLSAEANQRAILADRDGGVPAAGAAAGIEPRPAIIARGEEHGGATLAVDGQIDCAILGAHGAVDGLRREVPDLAFKHGQLHGAPGGAVVARRHVLERWPASRRGDPKKYQSVPWSFQKTGAASAASAKSGHGSGMSQSSAPRSEEHTSELQSLTNLVCRL